jgi:hypothetical protein
MKTIYKYPILVVDEQTVIMPFGAEILTVQMQNGQPCLWALVDTSNPINQRHIQVRGTGHDCSDAGRYIGTFQMENGELVFHVFEVVK